uniref:Lga2 protein n=1 Tax=Macalpinomyces eriachnes TaxID=307738 RepID=H2CZ37_9BASI|nr:Lga2 protein [Macalpinomyces eriachnes]
MFLNLSQLRTGPLRLARAALSRPSGQTLKMPLSASFIRTMAVRKPLITMKMIGSNTVQFQKLKRNTKVEQKPFVDPDRPYAMNRKFVGSVLYANTRLIYVAQHSTFFPNWDERGRPYVGGITNEKLFDMVSKVEHVPVAAISMRRVESVFRKFFSLKDSDHCHINVFFAQHGNEQRLEIKGTIYAKGMKGVQDHLMFIRLKSAMDGNASKAVEPKI